MIYGIFHQGSGLGNQLFRYVATRSAALSKGVDFSMIAPENFKGTGFMELYMGKPNAITWTLGAGGEVVPNSPLKRFHEKKVVEDGVDIRSYDPEINFIEDDTIIDGEFQDERYFDIDEVTGWLRTKRMIMPDDYCIIGFRGGEFTGISDLYLPVSYWQDAMALMRQERPDMKFVCVTDDPASAARMLPPEVTITHDIGEDWRKIRNANYLIIANSSFYILPALINNHVKKVIAPRYWARHNTGVWALPQNYYEKFTYI